MEIPEVESIMRRIAGAIDDHLNETFGRRIGFMMITFEFNEPGIANYISNAKREDMITALKETIERFEKRETIPAIKGTA